MKINTKTVMHKNEHGEIIS